MPTNRPARLLLAIMFIVAAITVYARFRGPDCDSGTTDSYSPDLRADQLAYLDKVHRIYVESSFLIILLFFFLAFS